MSSLAVIANKEIIKDLKHGTLSLRSSKSFHDLVAKAVHNKIVQHSIFSDEFLSRYSWMYKGKFTKAIGEGIRYIIPQGMVAVEFFEPSKSGDTVCLKIPYPINEVYEIVGTIGRFAASVRIPDILECYNIFTDVNTLMSFVNSKVGNAMLSIETHIAAYLEYAMSICPWATDKKANVLSFGAAYLNCVEWGDESEIKKVLDKLKQTFKTEVEDKEKAVKNIYTYDTLEWYPEKLKPAEKNAIKKYKKPTADISDEQMKKLVGDNGAVSPIQSIIGICNAILHHVNEMEELSFQNDPNFPGDNYEEIKNYGKEAAQTGIMCRCSKQNLIVYMNKALKVCIQNFMGLSNVNPNSTYANIINEMGKLNIVGSDLLPFGCVKLFDKSRYSIYSLYDMAGNDRLFQRLVDVCTAHKAIMIAVRTKGVAMRVLNFSNIYMPPLPLSRLIKPADAVELA